MFLAYQEPLHNKIDHSKEERRYVTMSIGILGRKVGMTQFFDKESNAVPITVIEAGPCPVVQKKTVATDQYNAIQVGFLDQKRHRVNKPKLGHFDKANVPAKRFLREIRLDDHEIQNYEVGQEVKVDIFASGEYVDVTGYTKGKGFTGVVKRYGFHGVSSISHGSHEYFRHVGAVSSGTSPGRVFKGKRMPGRKGNERVTILNLQVIDVRPEQNLLLVKGSVPGPINGLLLIRKTVKRRKKQK
jgi:large subunit ribosomal protein L3